MRDDVGVTELSVQGLYKAFGSHPVLAGLDLSEGRDSGRHGPRALGILP